MRHFLLAGNVAYSNATSISAVAAGAVGVFFKDPTTGLDTVTATGAEVRKEANLVLGRASANGGPIVLPLYKKNFSYAKGTYQASAAFVATVTIAASTEKGEHSIIIAKKGVKFNERNKWTATEYVKTVGATGATIATALAAKINANTSSHGIVATVSTATITLTAQEKGVDYKIIPADKLTGLAVNVTTPAAFAYGDAAYVTDLANKAAADAGFEYTYRNEAQLLYPSYPLNPLAGAPGSDSGYTIFTLRFAEPRQVKTRDEVVHQIIQVAFPTGASAIATFEAVVKSLADVYVAPAG